MEDKGSHILRSQYYGAWRRQVISSYSIVQVMPHEITLSNKWDNSI